MLVGLAFSTQAAWPQSCAGLTAGSVCRPSAGACDVAETCATTSGTAGSPLFQPADGTLGTNVAWNYTMGYSFTPNKTLLVTALGGFFNGTKTVYLYNRTTGAVLASATVTAANTWGYTSIAPVNLDRDVPYSIAVYVGGAGGAYRSGMAAMPRALADATINGSCYRAGSTAEPCASSGLISGTHYGMADFKYLITTGLYQPADGTLSTDVAGNYLVGYAFTPNKNLTLTHLGGLFNGTRTVSLYNRTTGAVLASASVPSANVWNYTRITPLTLTAGTPYTVAVYHPGTGGAYRAGLAMPTARADASIEGTCYRPSTVAAPIPTGEPCAYSGLVSGTNYGMADIKYAATGGGLTCPADSLVPAGSVCRAASGACDVAETCTGTSAACPANAFRPAGFSCNDGALCTYNDVCNGSGTCGGTAITCGGGNACSTTVCNGTSTCQPAQIFCNEPPGECYNTLGTCNTANGSCSYTVKTGAPCGTRGTCQSNGTCFAPPLPAPNAEPPDCDPKNYTVPAPTPIGCDSCDPSRPCVVDTNITVPVEYRTCSGYTPRKGDIVVHEADGLTRLMVSGFGSNWTHVGVFLDPRPPGSSQDQQLVRHHALNQEGLEGAVLRPSLFRQILTGLTLDASSAYCKSAKLNPATLFDPVYFLPGVLSSHTADITTQPNGEGGLWWETGIRNREVILPVNRAAGEDVADRMLLRNDYYSLNSLLDEAKGRARLSGTKPGTNCASAIMSCITPGVPPTLLKTDKMRDAARRAYEALRRQVRWMDETESSVDGCRWLYGCPFGGLCPVDCNGLAWEVANGIADQIIACILFGPGPDGCECSRDNRKWHFANWAGAPPAPPTQDDVDWVNGRLTDIEFIQDPWTGDAAAGQPVTTIYESYSYLPGDVMKSGNYPPGNAYPLVRKTNAERKYGHCWVPPALTVTPSPAASYVGTPITWTATASGGHATTIQYAFFRRRAGGGTADWIPSVSSPAWQSGNVLSWTPTSADAGNWDTYVWVKDSYTPANMNTYSYAAGFNPGGVQIVTVPTLTGTVSPTSAHYGTARTWTAGSSGGTGTGRQFAFFRRRGGTSDWIPDPASPNWQAGNVFTWTPSSSDVASWETYIWVRDSATPAGMNTYGYAAGFNTGGIEVTSPQAHPPTGWVDGYNTQHIWGWACDPDYPTQSNRVDVWSTSGQFLGSAEASIPSSAPINSACGGGTAHYFDVYPSGGIPSGTRFNVWSIDLPYATPGNDNRKLGGSGSTGDGTEFVVP
jgi:hypothetical protein